MQEIPQQFEIGDVRFERVDAPEELACWAAQDTMIPTSLVMSPAMAPDQRSLELLAYVLSPDSRVADVAAEYLVTQLSETGDQLSAADSERLRSAPAPFDQPEIVVWDDGTWMLRFAETGLDSIDAGLGVGVSFFADVPSGVDMFEEAFDAE